MPAEGKLGRDAGPTALALSAVWETGLEVRPIIVCLDRMTHFLQPRLMTLHCTLQPRGLPEDEVNLVAEKGVKPGFKRLDQRGLGIHGHGYAKGCQLFSWLKGCPLRKASRTSMSFSRVLGTVSCGPSWLAFA